MREKLLELMKNEGLKPSQLAELLEINPAGISHLVAGRNKPSFELLQKILRRFPRINPDWLLLDSVQMYRDTPQGTPAPTSGFPIADSDLFAQPQPVVEQTATGTSAKPSENRTDSVAPGLLPKNSVPDGLQVERVVVFYSDHSFESYTPKR